MSELKFSSSTEALQYLADLTNQQVVVATSLSDKKKKMREGLTKIRWRKIQKITEEIFLSKHQCRTSSFGYGAQCSDIARNISQDKLPDSYRKHMVYNIVIDFDLQISHDYNKFKIVYGITGYVRTFSTGFEYEKPDHTEEIVHDEDVNFENKIKQIIQKASDDLTQYKNNPDSLLSWIEDFAKEHKKKTDKSYNELLKHQGFYDSADDDYDDERFSSTLKLSALASPQDKQIKVALALINSSMQKYFSNNTKLDVDTKSKDHVYLVYEQSLVDDFEKLRAQAPKDVELMNGYAQYYYDSEIVFYINFSLRKNELSATAGVYVNVNVDDFTYDTGDVSRDNSYANFDSDLFDPKIREKIDAFLAKSKIIRDEFKTDWKKWEWS